LASEREFGTAVVVDGLIGEGLKLLCVEFSLDVTSIADFSVICVW